MEVLEYMNQWSSEFENGWLAHVRETGQVDWSLYNRPRNRTAPGVAGIDLSGNKLMLISSAGAYQRKVQEPFNAADIYGDYSLRTFATSTPLDSLTFAHDHYDTTMVQQDPQVALPTRHLERLVKSGIVGSLAHSVASFMGYQPDAARVVKDLVPEILTLARNENVQAALLAPL